MRRVTSLVVLPLLLLATACSAPRADDTAESPAPLTSEAVAPAPATPPPAPRHFDAAPLMPLLAREWPHQWRDETHGFVIASDFPREEFERVVAPSLARRIQLLATLFPGAKIASLVIHVDARPSLAFDGATIQGLHRGARVYVFAGDGSEPPAIDRAALRDLDHELVHGVIRLAGLELPRWLEEGLAQTLANTALDAAGRARVLPDEAYADAIATRFTPSSLPPLADLLRADAHYPSPEAMTAFYLQSWSFVDFVMATSPGVEVGLDLLRHTPREDWLARETEWREHVATFDPCARHAALLREGDPLLAAEIRARLAAGSGLPCAAAALELALSARRDDRAAACEPLARDGAGAAEVLALLALLDDPDELVHRTAARALRRGGPFSPAGIALLAADAGSPRRASLLLARARHGDLRALIEWLSRAAVEIDGDELRDSCLTLVALLPDACRELDGIDAASILALEFDPSHALAALLHWLRGAAPHLEFDPATRTFRRTLDT
jgi:hypothetical protein